MGRPVSGEEFAGLALALRDAGVENINIVTGSHAVPALVLALDKARERGLDLPVLWNSSAYEGGEALELLRDRVDVYLPDLKTLDSRLGERFFRAPDYPGHAQAAILRMLSFQGELRWKGPVLAKGVIIRHLIIPGYMESTRNVIEWFSRHARGRALLSLMTQYTPCPPCPPGSCPAGSGPRRRLIREEYLRVMDWLTEFGVDDGFYQAPAAGSDWLPDFTRRNPFSSSLSIPVWHWKDPVPGGTAGGVFARDAESPILK
jgi:putative pyruvate formate lyase activating enzyme